MSVKKNVTELYCCYNNISNLDYLPDGLLYLHCYNNNISNIRFN
jgi:hypothetical protein